MQTIFASALITTAALAQAEIPISGRYPGWSQGVPRSGINVELFIDLLCSDCAHENDVINTLAKTEWNGSTFAEQIGINFTPFVLPYHNHSF